MAEVIAAGADSNDVLLHPDALHCLKRRQLENLCIRLDLKATGKKDELVARLEGYAKGKVALGSSPSRGKMVRARPRTRTMSTRTVNSQTTIGGDENYDVDQEMNETVQENGEEEEEEEDVKGVLTAAGPSIRLITSQGGENDDGDVGQIFESYSGGNSRTPLGEVAGNECCQQTEATSLVTSSSTSKSIYPWKRIASTSIPKLKRNFSSASTVKGKDDSSSSHTTEEGRKSINAEFGVGGGSAKQEEGGSMPRNGSLSSLKKWLSKSKSTLASSSSSPSLDQEMASPPSHPTTSTPPSEPVLAEKVSSPTATKRKHGDEEGIASALANQEVEEIPVKRMIKGRPSRAIRQNQNVAAASPPPPPPVNLSSPTSITKDDFSKAASKVMEEVNARLQQSGKATMVQIPKQGAWSVSSVGAGGSGGSGLQPPSSPLKSVNSRTKGRFSGEHAKHFGKMDSIASHYAAKRIEQANKEWRSTSSGSSKSNKSSASSTHPTTNKRIKIAEQSEAQVVKAAESRAIVQRKLDLSRQRRKSAGRKSISVSSTPRAGFRSKISGAVRGFVGAARGKTASSNSSNTQQIRSAATPVQQAKGPAEVQRKVTPPQRSVVIPPRSASGKDKASTPQQQQTASKSKPAFDLKASLARKPKGYTPYSAKETVQLLQTNPAGLNASPTKTLFPTTAAVNTPSPIRSGWTFIPSPNGNGTPATPKMDNAEASSSTSTFSSSIVFPSVSPSPAKEQQNQSDDLASQVRAAPRIIRQPSAHITAARKTRSSISNAKRATGQVQSQQADRLKKAARVNELKHQASMAARRRTGSAIQRAVERGERIAAEINSGTGRGSPRKASGRITMEGAGRGSAAVKRVS